MKAIVTGSSRGIGFETARRLAQKGHQVIITARSEKQLKENASESEYLYPKKADLTVESDVSKLIEFAKDNFTNVDILINNAGALVNKPFVQLSTEDWKSMIDIHLLATVQIIKALYPLFSSKSHIVNISSMGGYQGSSKFPGLTAYSVAKGAQSLLSECLAAEFADRNISVNTLCLGAVQTEMLENAFPGYQAPVSAAEMGKYIADFATGGHRYYNGKILPVSLADPD